MAQEERKQEERNKEGDSHVKPVLVLGLALLFSTLVIHSVPNMPFIDIPRNGFFQVFAPSELAFAALLTLILALMAAKGRTLSLAVLLGVGIVANTVGGIAYCSLIMLDTEIWGLIVLTACLLSAGNVALCLLWCRIAMRYSMRNALVFVACGSGISALVVWVMMLLPPLAKSVLMVVCMVGLSVISLIETRGEVQREIKREVQRGVQREVQRDRHFTRAADRSSADDSTKNTVRTNASKLSDLLRLTGISLLGLVFFAFALSIMRADLRETLDIHLLATMAISCVLLVYSVTRTGPLIMRNLQLTFIPLLSLLLLTVTSLSEIFVLDGAIERLLVYLLYLCAALLTLATLIAVAHAQEFSADLVAAGAIFLFTLASSGGQVLGNLIASEPVDSVVVIITMIYAFVVMLCSYMSWKKTMDGELQTVDELVSPVAADTLDRGRKENCEKIAANFKLTRRELEVLTILAEGHGGPYISEVLYISPNTARTHIRNIYQKLGVGTREEILSVTQQSTSAYRPS